MLRVGTLRGFRSVPVATPLATRLYFAVPITYRLFALASQFDKHSNTMRRIAQCDRLHGGDPVNEIVGE
jgi:hypothetical protein